MPRLTVKEVANIDMKEKDNGGISPRRGIHHAMKIPSRLARFVMGRTTGSIIGVHTEERCVALTFDDGPHPDYTPRIVDIFNKYNAKATFFMVGESAKRHPDVVKYVASSGHAIANHTWDHAAVSAIGSKERRRQILSCEEELKPHGVKLFRPPYGYQSIGSYIGVRRLGCQVVTWTRSVEDWLDHEASQLERNIQDVLSPGRIILMHDVLYHTQANQSADREPLIEALDNVLSRRSKDYRFVTVPELLRTGNPRKRAWFWKADIPRLNALNDGIARQY